MIDCLNFKHKNFRRKKIIAKNMTVIYDVRFLLNFINFFFVVYSLAVFFFLLFFVSVYFSLHMHTSYAIFLSSFVSLSLCLSVCLSLSFSLLSHPFLSRSMSLSLFHTPFTHTPCLF